MPVKSVSYSINHMYANWNAGILDAVHHMTKQFWIKEEGEDEILALNSLGGNAASIIDTWIICIQVYTSS